ncbi:MAG: DUF1501 domain-containing protein [Blastocatellia bacterium]
MKKSRRVFLRRSGLALGGAVFASSVRSLGLVSALAKSDNKIGAAAPDYKALVCIFMFGGNDCNNTIIPYDGYANYASRRGSLALPQANLLQISPPSQSGVKYGLHPSLSPEVATPTQAAGLLPVWNQNKLAVICNVGTLVQPITRAQYLAGSPRPDNLFSHEDQTSQGQSAIIANTLLVPPTGWGARMADKTGMLNGTATFPMIVSMSGAPLFATSDQTRPLVPSGGLSGFANPLTGDARFNAMQFLMTLDRQSELVDAASDNMQRAVANTDLLNQALNNTMSVTTVFPNTNLGNQLKQVARIIAKRSTLFGMQRQIFFCSLGGFDTHENQLSQQANLLAQLGPAMKSFYDSTVELGVASSVTSFTLSDFGRTLVPTSSGSDHAWGSHQFVMGGAVNGGNFYGTYPTLTPGGPDDTGSQGRWIPKLALDQYGWTLAKWFGLPVADIGTVFPNIASFSPQDIGFMA